MKSKSTFIVLFFAIAPLLSSCDKIAQYDKAAHDNEESKREIAQLKDKVKALDDRLTLDEGLIATISTPQRNASSTAAAPPPARQAPPVNASPRIDPTEIRGAIAACVQTVHEAAPADFSGDFYRKFDAYYDEGSGLVKNNAQLVGDQPPKFLFEKCLSGKGYSLH